MKQLLLLVAAVASLQGGSCYKNYISQEDEDSSEHGVAPGSAQTSCPCGWTNKARVVGGKETLKNEYPLMLGLIRAVEGDLFCGASILTKRHALTAAHCTQPVKGEELLVVAGAHNVAVGGEHDTIVKVQETIEHEEYSSSTLVNDIALVILAEPLEFNQFVGPVCMPSQPYPLVDNHIKLLGWGKTKNKGIESDVLLKVNLRVTSLKNCQKKLRLGEIDVDNPKQICTFRRGKDSCQGDSGGPLLWLDHDTNRLTQVALVSYGRECGGDVPAVNTDVFAYVPWIKNKIAESNLGLEVCERI